MKALLDAVAALAVAAGDAIMSVRDKGELHARAKADKSPVTDADMAADAVISKGLARIDPRTLIVSEEDGISEPEALAAMRKAGRYWIIDPLDGTKDFVAGTEDFTVNIALVEGAHAVLGCVYAPARRELYVASKQQGAYRSLAGKALTRINTKKVDPSAPLVLLSRFHRKGEQEKIAQWIAGARFQPVGSSYKYCVIATGAADLAVRYSPTSLWDTAAAQCVLTEAGGGMRALNGAELTYDGHAMVNPGFIAFGDERALALVQET